MPPAAGIPPPCPAAAGGGGRGGAGEEAAPYSGGAAGSANRAGPAIPWTAPRRHGECPPGRQRGAPVPTSPRRLLYPYPPLPGLDADEPPLLLLHPCPLPPASLGPAASAAPLSSPLLLRVRFGACFFGGWGGTPSAATPPHGEASVRRRREGSDLRAHPCNVGSQVASGDGVDRVGGGQPPHTRVPGGLRERGVYLRPLCPSPLQAGVFFSILRCA